MVGSSAIATEFTIGNKEREDVPNSGQENIRTPLIMICPFIVVQFLGGLKQPAWRSPFGKLLARPTRRMHATGWGEENSNAANLISPSAEAKIHPLDFNIWRSIIRNVASKARSERTRRMNSIVLANPPVA